jgi:predicted lipoprotein with Yx(FWY)xxD motif
MPSSRNVVAALSLAALASIAAGCGGSSSGASSSGSTAMSSSEGSGATATVSTAEAPGLGTVLVDSEGFTVYSFARDRDAASSCYGPCAQAWPPVIAKGKPAAAEGAMSSELGTTERKDGTLQATYAGHPLYTFVDDRSPGEANGNGSTAFGGEWNALEESGAPAATSAGEGESSAPAESSEPGGYGY